jgi:outer membrane protein OmpU
MKKVLLGTTALVAAGLVSAPSFAADPVSLSLGGYYRTAIGAILDDDDSAGQGGVNAHDYFHEQDVEVHFTGETTLDNGLTVGVNVQLEGQTQGGDQIDETWAYVSGSWGELRIGDEDDVAYNFAYIAPYAGLFGPSTPWFAFSNAGLTPGNATFGATNFEALGWYGDTSKLYYTTPSFNGFQLGVSYAPDQSQDTRSNPGGAFGAGPLVGNSSEDIWSAALGYSGEFESVSVGLSAGYLQGDNEGAVGTDGEAWGIGANFGFGAWSFGGSYQDFNAKSTQGTPFLTDYTFWDVGLTYHAAAWSVGIGFSRSEATAGNAGSEDDNDVITLGIGYDMGPGVQVSGGLSYNNFDNGTTGGGTQDYDAISAMMGLTIDY